MKKLLGLLAVAPMGLAACTVSEVETFTITFDLPTEELSITVDMESDLETLADYMLEDGFDAEIVTTESATLGHSLTTVNGNGPTCEDPLYSGWWGLFADGEQTTLGMSSLEVEADVTYSWEANWCSFDWSAQTSQEALYFEAGGSGVFTGTYIDNLSGSDSNGFQDANGTVYTQGSFINNSGVTLVVGNEYQVYFEDTTYGNHTGGYNTVYMSEIIVGELKEITA